MLDGHPPFVQLLFLLCCTAVEVNLALMVFTPARYLHFVNPSASPRSGLSWPIRLLCLFQLLAILFIQYGGARRLLRG